MEKLSFVPSSQPWLWCSFGALVFMLFLPWLLKLYRPNITHIPDMHTRVYECSSYKVNLKCWSFYNTQHMNSFHNHLIYSSNVDIHICFKMLWTATFWTDLHPSSQRHSIIQYRIGIFAPTVHANQIPNLSISHLPAFGQ